MKKILSFLCVSVMLMLVFATSVFAASDPEIAFDGSMSFYTAASVENPQKFSHNYVTIGYEYANCDEVPGAYFEIQPRKWKTTFLWIGEWVDYGTPLSGVMRDNYINYGTLANPNVKMGFGLQPYANIVSLGNAGDMAYNIDINRVITFSSNTLY